MGLFLRFSFCLFYLQDLGTRRTTEVLEPEYQRMLHKTQDACSLSEDSVLFTQTMQLRLCGRLPGKSSCSLWRSVWPLSARAQISLQFELGPCMPFYLGQVVRAARPGGPASSAACEDTPKTSLLGSSQVNVVGFATGGASASCTVHGILLRSGKIHCRKARAMDHVLSLDADSVQLILLSLLSKAEPTQPWSISFSGEMSLWKNRLR